MSTPKTAARTARFARDFRRLDAGEHRPAMAGRLLSWHGKITGRNASGSDKALRAQLRRCRTPGEAMFVPGLPTLFAMLYPDEAGRAAALAEPRLVAGLARVAIVSALVDFDKVNVGWTLARQMVGPDFESPVVSQLRARTVLHTREPDEALTRWQRLVPLIASKGALGINLPQLAQALCHWSEETRRDLSFAYFEALATPPRKAAASEGEVAAA